MEHSRVTHPKLTERLDAEFYRPIFVENEETLSSLGCCVDLGSVLKDLQLGYTGPTMSFYASEGPYYLSSKNIVDGHVEIVDGTDRISFHAHHNELRRTQAHAGDVLLSRTGTVGKGAVLFDRGEQYNIAAHIIALRPKEAVDPGFLSSFLNCCFGTRQSIRLQRGTIIQGLSVYDVPKMQVPISYIDAQSYVGNKVYQAEALRARAQAILLRVDEYQQRLIPAAPSNRSRSWVRVPGRRMSERLDAEFYPAGLDDYFAAANMKEATLGDICDDIYSGTTLPASDGSNSWQATVANLSPDFIEPELRQVKVGRQSAKRIRNHDLMICAAAHNANYIGKHITYGTAGDEAVVPSTEVLLVRVDRGKCPSSYVRAYLQSPTGFTQIQACVRGITAHLYPVDVRTIRVPLPVVKDADQGDWFACDDALLEADKQIVQARALVVAARLLVESLIERRVTEAELIAARKDPAADRALLERLSADGLDVAGADPLFPDLDKLEELLKETQQGTDE